VAVLRERVRRTLGIEAGEERLLLAAATALFLVAWAAVSVTNVAETYFLKRVGIARLPLVFLVNSVLLAGTGVAVGRLTARGDQARLLTRALTLLGVALLPLWVMVIVQATAAYVLLVIAAKQLEAIALLLFWTTLGGMLTGRQGKRLFALVTGGGTLGTICGSFASAPLGQALGMASLLPVAAVLLALAALATRPLRRWQAPIRRIAVPRRDEPVVRRFQELWRGWLFRLLVITSLLAGALGPMLYFQFSYVADLATRGATGEQRLLALYAVIRGWINIGVLAVQLLGTSALFRWVGVPLAAALSPVIYLLGMMGLSLRTSLPAGVGAMAGASLQDHAVYDPAQRILLTLFPERVRAAVTAIVDGVAKRVGGVVGNLVVLAIVAFGAPPLVGWIGLPVASAWVLLAGVLWWRYPMLLLEMIGSVRADAATATPLLILLDPATLRVLGQELLSDDVARCRAACAFVVEAAPARAVATLTRALAGAPPANRRTLVAALDRVLEGTRVASVEAAERVAAVLEAPDGLETIDRANLVQAYARLVGPDAVQPRWRALLDHAARDPSEAVRLAAVAALSRLQPDGDLSGVLDAALESRDPTTRQILHEELRAELLCPGANPSAPRTRGHVERLRTQLADPADRPHAALALADVVERHGYRMVPQADALLAHRDDSDPRVRTAVLRFVGAAGLLEEADWVTRRLGAVDAAESAAAERALRVLGTPAVDVLCETLRNGRLTARERALAVLRTLSQEQPLLEQLAVREVEAGSELLVHTEALRAGGASDLVVRHLRERVDGCAYTALLLLGAVLRDERVGRVSDLLRSAAERRDRAVLLEALEAALPPDECARVLPLLDHDSPRALAAYTARRLGRQLPSFDEAVVAVIAADGHLTAALLRGTLDAGTRARLGLDPDGDGVPYQTGPAAMAPDIETLLLLRSLDLFERLTTEQLAELAAAVTEVTFPPGRTIVAEGQFGDELFVIKSGEVRVTRAGIVLNVAKAGDFFGEMALLDGETRSATGTAVGPVRLLRLSREAVLRTMEEQPAIAIAICQTLSRRVRNLLAERTRRESK
jgi:AAA family ATP:ADP antiporter